MKTFVLTTLLLLTSAATPQQPFYGGDNGIYAEFVTDPLVRMKKCRTDGIVAACVTWRDEKTPEAMYLPNCCDPAWSDEDFARLCCHELRHVNGWPGDHPPL